MQDHELSKFTSDLPSSWIIPFIIDYSPNSFARFQFTHIHHFLSSSCFTPQTYIIDLSPAFSSRSSNDMAEIGEGYDRPYEKGMLWQKSGAAHKEPALWQEPSHKFGDIPEPLYRLRLSVLKDGRGGCPTKMFVCSTQALQSLSSFAFVPFANAPCLVRSSPVSTH